MTKTKPAPRKVPATPSRGGFRFDLRLVALVLALVTLAFFREVALEGLTFVSPDASAPAGFAKIGAESIQHGVYPLWNPYVYLGMPSFASAAYNPYIYPPDWPLALLAHVLPLPDLSWMLLYYFLGALFTAMLAMEWGARAEGALLSGVLFALVPNLVAVGSHGHGSQMVDSAYLPLLLWLTTRWMRCGGLHHLGWLALAGGFQMLRGHAQIAFYSWLAVGLYLLVEVVASMARREPAAPDLRTTVTRALGVGIAMGLAFGLAGFYNLPLRDYARYSIRGGGADGGVGMGYATSWSMAPWELGTLVIPNAVGFGGATYWGGMPFTDYPNAYIGIVALVLLIPAFLLRGTPRVFALVLAAVALMVSLGHYFPLYRLMYEHLPLFSKFRIPVMILLLFHLAACLGVAWGWSRALEDGANAPEPGSGLLGGGTLGRLMLGVGIALALVLVVGVMGQGMWRDGYVRSALQHRPGLQRDAAEFAYQAYVSDLGRAALFGLLTAGLVFLARRRKLPALLATALALGLLLVDVWPVSDAVMRPTIGQKEQNAVEIGRDDIVDFLQKQPGLWRFLPLTEFQSNRFAGFGIASIGGYHPAKPRMIQDLLEREVTSNLPWWNLLNVRYVAIDQQADAPGVRMVFQGQHGFVYENENALPRVTLIAQARVAPMDSSVIDSIRVPSRDVATWTWLEHDPGPLGPIAGGTATMASYGLNDVAVDVDTPGPALLRLADMWYPDWVATVDGAATPILRADYLLRAVKVPAGHHRVEFHFRSPSVERGLMLSLGSLVVILLMLVAGLLRRPGASRRTTDPATEAA